MRLIINQNKFTLGILVLLLFSYCGVSTNEQVCFKLTDRIYEVSSIHIPNTDTSESINLDFAKNHLNEFMCNEYFEVGGDSLFSLFTPDDLYEETVIIPIEDTDKHLGFLFYKFPTGEKRFGIFIIDKEQRKISNNFFEIDQRFYSYSRDEMKLDEKIVTFDDLDKDGQKEIVINRIGHNGTAYTSKEYIYLEYDENLKISSMFTFEALIDFPFKTLNRKVTVEDKELILKTFDKVNNDFIGEVTYIKKDDKFVLKDSLVTNQYLLPQKEWR